MSAIANLTLAMPLALTAVAAAQDGSKGTLPVRRDVTFVSQDATLAGHLYLPPDYQGQRQLPAVVVTGAWTTVKEQMPGSYAAELARRGFAALAFDFRGWGGSQGEPRFLEDPERKTQDIVAAAAFLAARPEVDAARVGGLGVCASAGYMSDAARRSPDIRALALVAPWLHDRQIVEAVYGGKEGVAGLLAKGRAAQASETPVIIEAASTTNADALMYQAPYYTETDRGLIPEYDNLFNVASWEPWLTYDGIRVADVLQTPTLAVHSKAAVIPDGVTEFVRRMGRRASILWLDEVSQFDFYDQPEPVRASSNAVAEHFRSTFERQRDVAAVTSLVEGVAVLADLGQFEALQDLYAEEVHVDYSSLSGQPAATVPAAELMRQWAAVLPGFDRTRHSLSNVVAEVDGDRAVVTADVTADHYVADLFWQVRGEYRYELGRSAGAWRIETHRLSLNGESGTRDAVELAIEGAASSPVRYLVRQRTSQAVRDFLTSLEEKDMTKLASLWAEDAVQDMPFSPEGFPKRVSSRDKLIEHYAAWPESSGDADFTSALAFYTMQDPEWVFATFRGKVDIVSTGRLYEQTYGGLFHVVNGKIKLFREYYDPAAFAYAFGLTEGGSFHK